MSLLTLYFWGVYSVESKIKFRENGPNILHIISNGFMELNEKVERGRRIDRVDIPSGNSFHEWIPT
ncbi:MAG TPA: hypothetical protein EYQ50_17875 [Verrucomicrobiales bacterium]|nr:hypothetical protein [Verrucomicrobiales bacterium]HIL71838.1 hypothetical protein [Verrucomicrobiota bacterium]